MKFVSIYLLNYIGIYNGMGLYEINIDMTKCKNRITVIRGDNGSGKSTLSKAMSLFPDSNDSFIPSLPAKKEIVLLDGNIGYKLTFIHGIKQNGDRETTKAYITKTFGNSAIELNENGNVSSYKEILYSELGLDANFAALSQLSNEDRGLADKKPAERKRFVNSIISSLEVYNNIYKTLNKRSSNYKSMINAIVAKLNILGDEKTLEANLDAIEEKINRLQDRKDMAIVALAKAQSTISILDPDGSIQSSNSAIKSELIAAEKDLEKSKSIINGLRSNNPVIKGEDLNQEYKSVIDRKNSLIIQNQISRNTVDSLMRQTEVEAEELNVKVQKLSTLQNGYSYETLKKKISSYKSQLQEIEKQLSGTGIKDIINISKEEYILALETLKDLSEHISSFKSCTDYSVIDYIVTFYLNNSTIPTRKDIQTLMQEKNSIDDSIERSSNELTVLSSRMSLLNQLNLRPSTCTDDMCSFIKEAVEFSKNKPKERYEYLDAYVYDLKEQSRIIQQKIEEANSFNDAINKFSVIVREIDKNGAILSKMPNGEMFKDKTLFFSRLISGYSFEYMNSIYQYIGLSNLFDQYKQLLALYNDCISELKVYESKSDLVNSLIEDIDRINKSISDILEKKEPLNADILHKEKQIVMLQELEGVYDGLIMETNKSLEIEERIKAINIQLSENERKMSEITIAINNSVMAEQDINKCTSALEPLMRERDKINHSLQMMRDYIKERDELQANYDFIETIKYYSSPTTGIQLVFMELYMGKIISLANELLGLLFGGQFVIQPFIINENEFRIPCLGSGYLNDDISSMSSSQIGMISMILSFALLHHSSTKYNIIKLDEIDGPLDYNNRVFFMDVLNNIMNIMGTEQCIMISHNSELQVDNCDVILLKHDMNNSDYNRGNIIWSY